jgi:hypothetical protein
MEDKKYKITYLDKFWHNEKGETVEQEFTLCVFAYTEELAREMAHDLIYPSTILSVEEQV